VYQLVPRPPTSKKPLSDCLARCVINCTRPSSRRICSSISGRLALGHAGPSPSLRPNDCCPNAVSNLVFLGVKASSGFSDGGVATREPCAVVSNSGTA